MHVKIEKYKSTLKLLYIFGFLFNEWRYWNTKFMQKSSM